MKQLNLFLNIREEVLAEFVVLPRMNLTMEEGTLAQWYKKDGDTIAEDEALCAIENEKTTEDFNSIVSGTILKIIGQEGTLYSVNTPIAIVGSPNEDISELLSSLVAEEEQSSAEEKKIIVSERIGAGVKMLPKIRRIIKDKMIDVDALVAFVGKASINEADIIAFEKREIGSRTIAAEKADRVEKMTTLRKSISKNMMESCKSTARLTNFMEVDLTDLMQKLTELKQEGKKVSLTAIMIKAAAFALKEHPIVNTQLNEEKGEIIYKDEINISFAVDVSGGLIVPVVKNADKLDLYEITEQVALLSSKAVEGKLSGDEMQGGTFTVSNVGMLDVVFFTPIINYPQTAILAVSNFNVLPRYTDDTYTTLQPRRIMTLGVTYDHRVIDGAPAARFLSTIKEYLRSPQKLF